MADHGRIVRCRIYPGVVGPDSAVLRFGASAASVFICSDVAEFPRNASCA